MQADEDLVQATCRGDRRAFEVLVERYQQRLLRFLMSRGNSRADAEDVLQDSFVNAYRYLASYDQRWRFSTWLYRIALREAARHAARAEARGETVAGDELDKVATSSESDPLIEVSAQSSRENLWLTARRVLSDDAYAAMWLRYVEDMPVRDVATSLERSTSWTKVTLMRSRERLAKAAGDLAAEQTKENAYGQI